MARSLLNHKQHVLDSVQKMLVQNAREELEGQGVANEDLQIIEQEIRRLERSLQSFLDFAKPPKLHKTTTEVGTILERTIELIRGRAEKQSVSIMTDAPARSLMLQADASQLQQVILNLALNALDVMPTGGTLSLAMRATDALVEIAVADTGPGSSPEVRARLVQPFATNKATGLGLGLVISRRIIEDHGGKLDADNADNADGGAGACFRILLPIACNLPDSGGPRLVGGERAVASDHY